MADATDAWWAALTAMAWLPAMAVALAHADDPRSREALRLWVAAEAALTGSRLVLWLVASGAPATASGTWPVMLPGALRDGLDGGLLLASLAWRALAVLVLMRSERLAAALRVLPLAAIALAVAGVAAGSAPLRSGALLPCGVAVAATAVAVLAWRLRQRDGRAALVIAAVHAALAGHALALLGRAVGLAESPPGPSALPGPGDALFESVALALGSLAWLRLLQNRLRLRIARLRTTDGLTGALNRQQGLAALDRALARSNRDDAPLFVALLDLEDFGEFNDAQGYATADRLLTTVARSCLRSLRASDAVGRWAGGQLLLVMPDVNADDIVHVIERLRRQIDEAVARAGLPAVSVQLGLWERPARTTGITPDQAVRGATRQLLRARRQPERASLSARDAAW